MKQNKLQSFIEAITNTFIGFLITMSVYPLINWICGIEMSIGQAGASTVLFTVVSVIRGYVIRRFFNNMSAVKDLARKFANKYIK
jgi:predicted Na+-dependent transporter